MAPQCCSQALEELYSAPGKARVPCLLPSATDQRGGPSACSETGLAWGCPGPLPASSPNPSLSLSAEVGGIAEPTEAADCWSFGSLLYELLTGVVRGRGAAQRWDGGTEVTPCCKSSHPHPIAPGVQLLVLVYGL